jgi:hypothetical protein
MKGKGIFILWKISDDIRHVQLTTLQNEGSASSSTYYYYYYYYY